MDSEKCTENRQIKQASPSLEQVVFAGCIEVRLYKRVNNNQLFDYDVLLPCYRCSVYFALS